MLFFSGNELCNFDTISGKSRKSFYLTISENRAIIIKLSGRARPPEARKSEAKASGESAEFCEEGKKQDSKKYCKKGLTKT